MDRNELKKLTEEYVSFDKEYREYRDQFFGVYWEGEYVRHPKKVFNRESIDKIQEMKKKLDDLHEKWLGAMRAGHTE